MTGRHDSTPDVLVSVLHNSEEPVGMFELSYQAAARMESREIVDNVVSSLFKYGNYFDESDGKGTTVLKLNDLNGPTLTARFEMVEGNGTEFVYNMSLHMDRLVRDWRGGNECEE